ncbi:MAG: hypothetical protein ABJQ90_00015 [Parasphingorhabdus sp.]
MVQLEMLTFADGLCGPNSVQITVGIGGPNSVQITVGMGQRGILFYSRVTL